jgi:hypothetical protein
MALTEKTIVDKYEIVGPWKHIQVRESLVIERDGVPVSKTFHRYVLVPSDDISEQPEEIKNVANLLWTQQIKDSWNEHRVSIGQ